MNKLYHILITLDDLEATAIITRAVADGWIDTIEYLKGLYRADISVADLLEYYPPEEILVVKCGYHHMRLDAFNVWYSFDHKHLIFAEESAS